MVRAGKKRGNRIHISSSFRSNKKKSDKRVEIRPQMDDVMYDEDDADLIEQVSDNDDDDEEEDEEEGAMETQGDGGGGQNNNNDARKNERKGNRLSDQVGDMDDEPALVGYER